MKKIICMLAMALLVIGAAQAQNQVRKMVVRTDDGQEVKFKVANIQEVTFEEVAVPTTVEEAKAMLVGYWKCDDLFLIDWLSQDDLEYLSNFEASYIIVTEDLEVFLAYKIADSCTDEQFAEYAGKILVIITDSNFGNSGLIVNSEDPTTGDFMRQEWSEGEWELISFMNLDQNSFDAQWEFYKYFGDDYQYNHDYKGGGTFNRVEPFEYIMPSDGLMKK